MLYIYINSLYTLLYTNTYYTILYYTILYYSPYTGGRPYEPEACEKLSKNLKHKLKQMFINNEMKRFSKVSTQKMSGGGGMSTQSVGERVSVDLDDDDIDFIVCQVWRSRCAITQRKFGGHATLVLTRWDAIQPPTPYNLVLLMPHEAEKLAGITGVESGVVMGDAAGGGTGDGKVVVGYKESLPVDVIERIEARLRWAKKVYEDVYLSYDTSTDGKSTPLLSHIHDRVGSGDGVVTGSDEVKRGGRSKDKSYIHLLVIPLVFIVSAVIFKRLSSIR